MLKYASQQLAVAALLFGFTLAASAQAPVKVAVFMHETGTEGSNSRKEVLRTLSLDKRFTVETIVVEDVLADRLNEFNVVIFPGGVGGRQGNALGAEGREKVRNFVAKGGDYLGICAGAYLALSDFPWSLNILNGKVQNKQFWARGKGDVMIKLSDYGQKNFQAQAESTQIFYANGPMIVPGDNSALPPYTPWAEFETNVIGKPDPRIPMVGNTAIASGTFGKGQVLVISPHPENTKGLEPFLHRGIDWLLQQNP